MDICIAYEWLGKLTNLFYLGVPGGDRSKKDRGMKYYVGKRLLSLFIFFPIKKREKRSTEQRKEKNKSFCHTF